MTVNGVAVQPVLGKAAMAEFRTVARVGDLADGEARAFEVGTKLVALFRQGDGYFAIDDVCPHMGASLAGGDVEAGVVTCPWHGWRFRLADGVWADNPRLKIGCYPVRVVGDEIQVQV
jgi:nitrite reductase (NADH) small subunit/3-phenylpropionate/trans-cinnamate dioxygenase ferredoxin subunit